MIEGICTRPTHRQHQNHCLSLSVYTVCQKVSLQIGTPANNEQQQLQQQLLLQHQQNIKYNANTLNTLVQYTMVKWFCEQSSSSNCWGYFVCNICICYIFCKRSEMSVPNTWKKSISLPVWMFVTKRSLCSLQARQMYCAHVDVIGRMPSSLFLVCTPSCVTQNWKFLFTNNPSRGVPCVPPLQSFSNMMIFPLHKHCDSSFTTPVALVPAFILWKGPILAPHSIFDKSSDSWAMQLQCVTLYSIGRSTSNANSSYSLCIPPTPTLRGTLYVSHINSNHAFSLCIWICAQHSHDL